MSSLGSLLLRLRPVIVGGASSTHRRLLASSLLPLGLLSDRPRVQVPSEGVERVGPDCLVLRDPLIQVGEAFGVQRVDALLSLDRDLDQLRLPQDLEVARDAGLRKSPELRDVAA